MSNYDGKIEPLPTYHNQGNENYLSSDKPDTYLWLAEENTKQAKQIELLQEQLKEANKTLKYFADSTIGAEQEDGRYICGMAGFDGTKGQIIYYDPRPAKQYLEKWGVK